MEGKTRIKRSAKNLPIAVIGGGPAGMTAAQTAVKNYKNVVLYDKNPTPGKKLGSADSRAIYVGERLSPQETAGAFGEKKTFILHAFKSFGWEKTQEHLRTLGFSVGLNGDRRLSILPEESSLLSLRLRDAAESAGVLVKKSSRVSDLVMSKGEVKGIVVNGVVHPVSAVIIASGSAASPKFGATMDGYTMAEKAGHEIVPVKPAMVGFETVERFGRILSGVLIRDCRMEIYLDNEMVISDRGDIVFTRNGVEGDLIYSHTMEITDLLGGGGKIRVKLDLVPDLTRVEIERLLGQDLAISDRTTVWQILTRYVPDRMLDVMHKIIRVHCRKPAVTLSNLERKLLAIWIKDFAFTIKRQRPFNETRGVMGGVSVEDIDPKTMRSNKVKNLYFAGDVMDLLAPWGGFNIEMAFSTGYLAGLSAGKSNGTKPPR